MPILSTKQDQGEVGITSVGQQGVVGPRARRPTFFYDTYGRGVPRYEDLISVRRLQGTHTISIPIDIITKQVSTTKFNIVPINDDPDEQTLTAAHEIEQWFKGGFNSNNESFDHFIKQLVEDILAIDAGIIEKVPKQGTPFLDEMYVRDGASFVKNPDRYGRLPDPEEGDKPAYYQFSFNYSQQFGWDQTLKELSDFSPGMMFSGHGLRVSKPIPFSREEITWIEESPKSYRVYGLGKVQKVKKLAEILLNSDTDYLRKFSDSEWANGIMSIVGASENQVQNIRDYWQKEIKGNPHKMPITGGPDLDKIEWIPLSGEPEELQFLEAQEWYNRLVWFAFGLSPNEVGQIKDVNRNTAKEQSAKVWRTTTKPLLELLAYRFSHEILPYLEPFHRVDGGLEFQWKLENPEVEELKREQQRKDIAQEIISINEARKDRGREPFEWGNLPTVMIQSLANQNPRWFIKEFYGDEFEDLPPRPQPATTFSIEDDDVESLQPQDQDAEKMENFKELLMNGDDTDFKNWLKDALRNNQSNEFPPLKSELDEATDDIADLILEHKDDLQDQLDELFPEEERESASAGAFNIDKLLNDFDLSDDLLDTVINYNAKAMEKSAEFHANKLEKDLEKQFSLQKDGAIELSFDVRDTFAFNYMKREAAQKMVTVEQTVKDRIQKELLDVAKDGGNVDAATEALTQEFTQLSENHSRLVARTEMLSSSRHGSQSLSEGADVIGGKQWRASDDGRERDWHGAMDKEIVGVNDEFKVPNIPGADDQPNDYPRSAFIVGEDQPFNCRCSQKPVLREDLPDDLKELSELDGVKVELDEGITYKMIEIKQDHAREGESFKEMLSRLEQDRSRKKLIKDLGVSSSTAYDWLKEFDLY